ncbi:MAG: DUF1836 domain-containing protein [Oscillospiraceae bacterium]|nr:DUF1836 domain-containing protein [Oscillospiraceae bacterium]
MKSTGLPTGKGAAFNDILKQTFNDVDLQPEEIPRLDLYMDQILTLFNGVLSKNSRHPGENPLTKTMINNYSKEKLLTPVQGKKYSREQIMQLLCVLILKQALTLSDIRSLMAVNEEEIGFERAYAESLRVKNSLREKLSGLIGEVRDSFPGLSPGEQDLATALVLSSLSHYLQRACEGMIDNRRE